MRYFNLVTLIIFSLILSSCGKSALDDIQSVTASSEKAYKYEFCGTITAIKDGVSSDGVATVALQNQIIQLKSSDEKITNILKNASDGQGCVYSNIPTEQGQYGELFTVEHMSSGEDSECGSCSSDYSPVCDTKNLKTYDNSCLASCSGVYSFTQGPCYN